MNAVQHQDVTYYQSWCSTIFRLTWNQDEGMDGAASKNLTYSYNLVSERRLDYGGSPSHQLGGGGSRSSDSFTTVTSISTTISR